MPSGSNCGRFSPRRASTSPSSRTPPRPTPERRIITIANADNTIVVVPGANALVSADDVGAAVLAKGDVAVSQFEIPLPTIAAFFQRARAAGATTILNPAPAIKFGPELLDLVDILVLNETELGLLTGTELRDTDDRCPLRRSGPVAATASEQIVCVTLGKRGVLALIDGEASIIAGRAVKAVDTTGAGDCLVGALAAQLAGGKADPRRAGLRQRRRLDLRAADGRSAVDADGRGG